MDAPSQAAEEKGTLQIITVPDSTLDESAQSSPQFGKQALEYMNDLLLASAELQGQLQGEFDQKDWEQRVGSVENSYRAAVKHAMSIPRPEPGALNMYNTYIMIVDRYKAFPELLFQGIEENNVNAIKEAFTQLRMTEGQYDRFIKIANEKPVS
jgi:hypothetical protein